MFNRSVGFDLLGGDLSMLSTPAPAPTNTSQGLFDVQPPAMGGGGGLNDLFSIQGALPGAGYVAPQSVSICSYHFVTGFLLRLSLFFLFIIRLRLDYIYIYIFYLIP